ncbi:AAA family ATPase [Vibrio parahaemolyticus]|nr:AAA family ATPase [Vibrio parahaemolyticus]
MFIESFSYKSKNVQINNVDFKKINVLVGASGAGKTTIINSIRDITGIATGDSFAGATWQITLKDALGQLAIWEGRFSKKQLFIEESEDDDKKAYEIEYESLSYKGDNIFKKSKDKVIFLGNQLPETSPNISLLNSYKSDANVKDIYDAIARIRIISTIDTGTIDSDAIPLINPVLQKLVKNFFKDNPEEKISKLSEQYNIESRALLYFAKTYDKASFEDVEYEFTSIFPFIRKINFRTHNFITDKNEKREYFFIELQTQDEKIIQQGDISSGMFKTLNILSAIYLTSPKSTIILDEVENSLGVNCLPDIINEISTARQQVIFSSHHPKIINKTPIMNWLIVARKDTNITVYKASELNIEAGNHDAFTKLLNHHIFHSGVSE